MSERGWRDLVVGDRMRVDEKFADAVERSGFSRSEWGMIMTAVEFEVAGEGESARLIADTSKVDLVMPELEGVADRMGGAESGTPGAGRSGVFGGGFVESLRSSLGLESGVDEERRDEAVGLGEEYAAALQGRLEERGAWERIRALAAEQDQSPE